MWLTFNAFALTSLTGLFTMLTSGGIAFASNAVYFPLVVMVMLKHKHDVY